jgi:hypothetical protein
MCVWYPKVEGGVGQHDAACVFEERLEGLADLAALHDEALLHLLLIVIDHRRRLPLLLSSLLHTEPT